MKTYTAKSSALRAAASHFNVARKMSEVEPLANIKQNDDGQWYWEPILLVDELAKMEEELTPELPTITANEARMLDSIYNSEYISAQPECAADVSTYVFSVADTKAEGGVLSSMVKKGLIGIDEDVDDYGNSGVTFTELGYRVYQDYDYSFLEDSEPEVAPEPEVEVTEKKVVKSGKTFKRPGEGTKTGRVWELADTSADRKEVMQRAAEEGLNLSMVAQQYYRWTHREEG